MSPRKSDWEPAQLSPEQAAAAAAVVAAAEARGLALTGPDGLLKLFTKNVLETALHEEMAEHLGHERNQAEPGRESTNVRDGTRSKMVVSDAAGEVEINVPRDRESTFEPQIVKKRQRRLTDVDEIVLSLYAKGMTAGDISAHFAEIYGASSGGGSICGEEFGEYLAGFLPVVDLTGSVVDLGGDGGEVVGIAGDGGALGEVLADDAVEVLVATAFPW